jgi:hypothetical protein
MRVEFVIHNHPQGVAALSMRAVLINMLPRIHHAPGLFWEFVQKYYSALHHPIIIDTGGHDFLQALVAITKEFSETIRQMSANHAKQEAAADTEGLKQVMMAVEEFKEGFRIEQAVLAFKRAMKLDAQATRVFLAAWAAWTSRNYKGRVLREDIASVLLRAGEPLELDGIADAIENLIGAGLLVRDAKLEIKFSPGGIALARKLQAKHEGIV